MEEWRVIRGYIINKIVKKNKDEQQQWIVGKQYGFFFILNEEPNAVLLRSVEIECAKPGQLRLLLLVFSEQILVFTCSSHLFGGVFLQLFHDEPIDVVKNLRGNRINIRSIFTYLFVFISTLVFLVIIGGQAMLVIQNYQEKHHPDHVPFLDSPYLDFLELLVPDFYSWGCFFYILSVFILSLVLLKTRKYEQEEAFERDYQARRAADPIDKIEGLASFQVTKAVQLIKDYKFKNHICLQLEIVLLMVISTLACNIIVLPYAFIFICLGLVMAISSKQSTLRSASNKFNLILLALLLVDLPGRYIIKATQLLNGETDSSFYQEIIGLLTTTPTYVDFYLKIVLLLIECQKLQYCYDYSDFYDQIRNTYMGNKEHRRYFRKKKSLTFKILKPISLFMFCTLAIFFSLVHPSIIFYCCLPLFIFGYFRKQSQYICLSKFFIFLIGMYIFLEYVYNITILLVPSSQKLENTITYIDKIFGFDRNSDIFKEIFPGEFDYFFYIIMAAFTMFIAKSETVYQDDQDASNNQPRGSIDDDVMTIPDDVSEAKSKLSMRHSVSMGKSKDFGIYSERSASGMSRLIRPIEIIDTIPEERKEEDGDLEPEERKSVVSVSKLSARHPGSVQSTGKSAKYSRDDTMRGKMKRCCYKIYIKMFWFFDILVEMAIIHSTKFTLLSLFCVSVFQVNLMNAFFFILFLTLSMASYSSLKTYWTLPCIYDSIIIILLFAYDVFCPNGIEGIDQNMLQLIGVVNKDPNANYFMKYLPYLFLLIVLVLNYYVIYSKRYEQFLDEITKLESSFREENENDQYPLVQAPEEQAQAQSKKPIKADPISKIIIKYAIYLLILALYMECSMVPVSALNFILLVLMTIVVIKYLYNPSQIKMYQKMRVTLLIIKYTSLIFIFLKYMFQFEQYASEYEVIEEAEQYYTSMPVLQILLGIENNYVPFKLFFLAIVMSLSNFMLKFLTYQYLYEVLKEEETDWNRLEFIDSSKKTKFAIFWHYFTTYFLFFIYNLFIFLPLIIVISISLVQISILGCLMLITTIIVMYKQKETYWEYSFQQIGIVTSIAMLSIYVIQLLYLCLPSDLDFIERLGVNNEIDSDGMFYKQYLPCFFVILSCMLQKISHKCKPLFVQTVTETELQQLTMQDQNIFVEEVKIIEEEQEKDDKESEKHKKPPEIGIEQDKIIKEAIYDYETPIRQCLNFRDKYMLIFFHSYGLILFNFMSLITMTAKLNISSVLYSIIFVLILNQRYYPNRFQETAAQQAKREKVNSYLKIQIALISAMIIEEYSMSFINLYFEDLIEWKNTFLSAICYNHDEGCVLEWNQWLSLAGFPISWITVDYLYLLTCYLNLHFTSRQVKLKDEFMLPQPKVNDKNDFLSSQSLSKCMVVGTKFIFQGFPFFLILYLIILACTFHGKGMTDLLSIFYLFFAFYYILHSRRLFSRNSTLLQSLRNYNIVVLYCIILFQIPIFVCPAVSESGDYEYIDKEQCAQIMKDYDNRVTEYGNNSWMAFYIVLTQSLGFYKVYGILQLDFIFLIVFTEIQNQIFYHPYFRVYVLKHMETDKETDGRLRAFMFVERSHLRVLWTFKTIKEEIKILHTKLQRIIKSTKDLHVAQEDFLKMQESPDKAVLLEDEEHLAKKEEVKDEGLGKMDKYELDKTMETHAVSIENYSLEMLEKPNTPVIPLKLFIETFKNSYQNYGGEKSDDLNSSFDQKLVDMVMKLQKIVHFNDRENLYKKEGIGLNFALQKGSIEYLKESEYKFFEHLILSEANSHQQRELELNQSLDQTVDQTFYVKQEYEEKDLSKTEEEKVQKMSFMNKIGLWIKNFLWQNTLDKILLYSLTKSRKPNHKQELTPQKMPLIAIFGYSILSLSEHICYLMIFIHFLVSNNLISLILPLSALVYALLDNPIPNILYWKFLMMYMFITIGAKFIYQLPLFCGTPPYSLFSLDNCIDSVIGPEILVTRIDYIIGIHKYSGPASYPYNQGIFRGVLTDIFVLLALMLHKLYLIQMGIWHYVNIKNNIYINPSFKCRVEDMTTNERIDQVRRDNYRIYEYERRNIFMRMWIKIGQFFTWCKQFIFKVLPRYMDSRQRNYNLQTQQERPYITHNVVKVKPGKNYFSEQFFTLLIILFYVLFFYKNITGESSNSSLSGVSLQRFSILQVCLLFFILILMAVERMLFKSRQMYSSGQQANLGILIKHALAIKLGIHVVLVLLIHILLGFVIPCLNKDRMSSRFALVLCYLLCVVYFVFSALQIKHGFQQRPYKPPFVKDVDGFTVMVFRIYKAIPFIWEMKVILDWTVTKTCLDLFQWFKIDDAINYLYFNRYQNNGRLQNPEFGQQKFTPKFFQGFCFAFGLILLILAPILLFSGITPMMVDNPVLSGILSIQIEMNNNGNQYNILSTQAFNILELTEEDLTSINNYFSPTNQKFETQYMQKMSFSPYSQQQWTISPPSINKLINDYYLF